MKRILKILGLGLLALVVAAAIWLGLIDPKKIKAQAWGVLASVQHAASGVMSGTEGPSDSAVGTAGGCRQNLRRIESAKRAIQTRGGFATGSVSWDAVIKEMGGKKPKCPGGGSYRLNTLEMLPTCSISANGTIDKSDDHIIKRY